MSKSLNTNMDMLNFRQYLANSEADLVGLYLHAPHLTIAELANHVGISKGRLYRVLERNGVVPNRLNRKHDQVHHLLQQGFNNADTARFTGYTERNVRNIKHTMKD